MILQSIRYKYFFVFLCFCCLLYSQKKEAIYKNDTIKPKLDTNGIILDKIKDLDTLKKDTLIVDSIKGKSFKPKLDTNNIILDKTKDVDTLKKDTLIVDSIKGKSLDGYALDTLRKDYIRLGVDIVHPIIYYLNEDDYKLELLLDVSVLEDVIFCLEVGNEITNYSNSNIDISTEGIYFKIGVDNNLYENALGENNLINVGVRYGMSFYDQTVNKVNITDSYWNTKLGAIDDKKNNYQSSFIEAIIGLKVQIFSNMYIGWSIRMAKSFVNKNSLKAIYIPGIGENKEGWHFNYNYFISFYTEI